MALLGDDDPDFLHWLQTGQMPSPAAAQPSAAIQPPVIQPLQPLPAPGRGMASALNRSTVAGNNVVQATQDVAAAGNFVNQKAAELAQPGMAVNEQQMQSNMSSRDESKARIDATAKEIQERIRAYGAEENDPTKYLKDKEDWQKIAIGIGMAISGALSPRGPNLVFEAILKIIDRNVAAKEGNLARRGKALDAERMMNKEDEARSRSDYMEAEERRLMLLEAVKQKALSEASKMGGNAQAQANANMLAAQAQSKQEEIALKAAGGIEEARIQAGPAYAAVNQREKDSKRDMAVQMMDQTQKTLKDASAAGARNDKQNGIEVKDTTGKPIGQIEDKVQARQATTFIQEYAGLRSDLENAKKFGEKVSGLGGMPGGKYIDENREKAVQYMNNARLRYKNMMKLGAALTNTELKPLAEVIPDDTHGLIRDPLNRIDELQKLIDAEADRFAGTMGLNSFVPQTQQTKANKFADSLEDY